MAEHRQVRYERMYVKESGTERLRKTAAGMARHLLGTGWREVERWYADRYVTIRYERTGFSPELGKVPYIPPQAPGRGRGDRGGPGGPGGRGGPGGPRR
ncbi:MAG TPA: hypothetical protein VF972_11290 [Actinomycetota bacterium]